MPLESSSNPKIAKIPIIAFLTYTKVDQGASKAMVTQLAMISTRMKLSVCLDSEIAMQILLILESGLKIPHALSIRTTSFKQALQHGRISREDRLLAHLTFFLWQPHHKLVQKEAHQCCD